MIIRPHVLRDLKARFDDDQAKLSEFLTHASPREVFQEYLEWNGIIGYSYTLFDVVVDLNTGPNDSIRFEGSK